MTSTIDSILSNYDSDNAGTKANLYRMLMHGKLSGSGKLLILPVDQGFEHGPARSFAMNSAAYDPCYHHQLAIDAGLSAYAAPLGLLEVSSGYFAGRIPTILKLNSSNSLLPKDSCLDQAITATPYDALRLGCVAIGFTIYPGSNHSIEMIEEAREIISIAKKLGLVVIVWSYPRGPELSKAGELALDVVSYAAHIACLIGAHIIKVKLPSNHIEQNEAINIYKAQKINIDTLDHRVRHISESCFNGKRLVVFSGGSTKNEIDLINEAISIKAGGGSGCIIGRNSFQRNKNDALSLLDKICQTLK